MDSRPPKQGARQSGGYSGSFDASKYPSHPGGSISFDTWMNRKCVFENEFWDVV